MPVLKKFMRLFNRHIPRRLRFRLMYLGSPPWDTGVTPPELEEYIRQQPPGRAIDLGCGTGTNLITLGKAGWQVTGVDFAERAVQRARQKLAKAGIAGEVRAGDVTLFENVSGTYDLVLDIGCYHGLAEAGRAAYRNHLHSILAPAGCFLIYAHWRSAGQESEVGISEYDFTSFCRLLDLVDRRDSQDRWDRAATWMRFRAIRS